MNKVGLHSGYWAKSGRTLNVNEIFEWTRKTGVDVVEIGPGVALSMSTREKLDFKAAVADAGMLINFNGGLDATNDIASDDPAIREKGIEYSKRALQAMSEMGGVNWSGINYSAWLRRPAEFLTPEIKAHYMELSVSCMQKIIKTAEDVGITYGFEVVNRFEQFLLNTAAEGVAYCEAVGSPNAKILLDTFHMSIEENDLREAIRFACAKDRLSHFHIGENNRRVPGIGPSHADWKGIFAAIKESCYAGYITMEPFVSMGNTSICVWRDLAADTSLEALAGDAAKGAEFIRGMLR